MTMTDGSRPGCAYLETDNERVLRSRYRVDAGHFRRLAEENRRRAECFDAAADAAAEVTSRIEGGALDHAELAERSERWLRTIRSGTTGYRDYDLAQMTRILVAAEVTGISGPVDHLCTWHASWMNRGSGEACGCASCRRDAEDAERGPAIR